MIAMQFANVLCQAPPLVCSVVFVDYWLKWLAEIGEEVDQGQYKKRINCFVLLESSFHAH